MSMKFIKNCLPILILFQFCLHGEMNFTSLDLNGDDELLITVDRTDPYGFTHYRSLIKGHPGKKEVKLLTHFPERSFLTRDGNKLFIWNRWGLFEKDLLETTPVRTHSFYPRVSSETPAQLGRLSPLHISPDGKYMLYYRFSDWSRGDLIIYDNEKGYSQLVTPDIDIYYSGNNIKWSYDSQFFAYVKKGSLYYFSIEKFLEKQLPEEGVRRLGEGAPGSFGWSLSNSLYFIVDNEILTVNPNEMFTLSFYDNPLQLSSVAGQFLFDFNPNFDRFWINPSGNHLIVERENGGVFLVEMAFRNYDDYSQIRKMPLMDLPYHYQISRVFWSKGGKALLLAESSKNGEPENRVFIYDPASPSQTFNSVDNCQGLKDVSLSPERDLISLVFTDRIDIYVFDSWNKIKEIECQPNIRVHWRNQNRIVIIREDVIYDYSLTTKESDLLMLSQIQKAGFGLDDAIKADSGGRNYTLDDRGEWDFTHDLFYKEARNYNDRFRVFLAENNSPLVYNNLVMTRSIEGYTTEILLKDWEHHQSRPPMLTATERKTSIFNHGSRMKGREVALVFNLTTSITEFTDILRVLSDYRVRATFFVNGDVIRKYPDAMRTLSRTNHEIGSLFYTVMDMTNRQYNIDKEFIKRGLARNEDDYFRATGKELLPIWHSPWYFVDSRIMEASREMNYIYVGRDIETLDWVGKDDDLLYYDTDEIIASMKEKVQPGSIIPFSLGTSVERDEYLFQRLDVILNGLIRDGFEIVTIGELIENDN